MFLYEKWDLLKKCLDKGLKPSYKNAVPFENEVLSLLKAKIAEKYDLKYVSPTTLGLVADKAKKFWFEMKELWKSTKVLYI